MINSFLLIGQSNMAGRGALEEVKPICNDTIFMFRDQEWQPAKEPLHKDKPEIAGLGLGMSFADSLQQKFQKKVGLIPCAFGGTALSEWQKGEFLYSNAVSVTLSALKNSRLKGILWHQGESDADRFETAESYKERFIPFIESLLQDLGVSNIPIILGELGEFLVKYEDCPYFNRVNQHLEAISQNKNYGFVSAKGLTDNGDFLHFNSSSLREFGHRYANAWINVSQRMGISLDA